ncbi:unnamed protein product [Schistocephalus solidus]|uniref:Transmembrane protein n=1 Tax=Schistocephalus solidus TaxID=70667 RepID=A0A183SH34_SCHSO|nr:unnamed protein product [Schistocephalus solidus]
MAKALGSFTQTNVAKKVGRFCWAQLGDWHIDAALNCEVLLGTPYALHSIIGTQYCTHSFSLMWFTSIIGAYAPNEKKIKFYEELHALLASVPKADNLVSTAATITDSFFSEPAWNITSC